MERKYYSLLITYIYFFSFFPINENRCAWCPDGCATCTDATHCTSCETGYQTSGTSCVPICSAGMK